MRTQTLRFDLVVIGGGLAGVCAAVAAARMGKRVALINNRPVLGGNASSEVRVWVCGATAHGNQRWARENGIIGEMFLENQWRNPEGNPVYWDDVVLDTVRREQNLELFLNTDVRDVVAEGPQDARRIVSVTGWTMGAETLTTFEAPFFADCTGDGLVGHLAGADYRLGKEGRAEFGESLAPAEPVREFLGSTIIFYTRDLGRPVKYVAPESAIDITTTPIPTSRVIKAGDNGIKYWWIEWGGELDIVADNERIRDELRGVVLGIWDHIKNSGEFDAENLTLEWIGNLPGKREYRRFVGDHTMTQSDVLDQVDFPDAVAFGGWSIDLHPAQGMYAEGAAAVQRFSDGTFGIPYRSLYSANVTNMFMAGRDFSASHIAFGAARVMATCAAMGQAVGTAAALCDDLGVTPRGLYTDHLDALRQELLRQDAPVQGIANTDPRDLARAAAVTASSTLAAAAADGDRTPLELTHDVALVVPGPHVPWLEVLAQADVDAEIAVEVWTGDKPQNVVPNVHHASLTATVPAGPAGWVRVPLDFTAPGNVPVLVVLRATDGVRLHTTPGLLPGVLVLTRVADNDDQNVQIAQDDLLVQWPSKPLRDRSLVFRAAPTDAYAPERAVGGYARPWGGPNLWVSEPGQEQWLRLDWAEPVRVDTVHLVLDDHVDPELNTLHRHQVRDEVIPTLLRDYVIETRDEDGSWLPAATVTGNRHRHRVHEFAAVRTGALRVRTLATNGAEHARVVSLRVEGPGGH